MSDPIEIGAALSMIVASVGEVGDLQERLEFTERMLTRQREAGRLPEGV